MFCDMELQSLTMLVEILDAGNLSEAARRLKMSRANVSYHLNQFERAVGQQLVRRTTRRIEPTEIGLRLYEHGRQIRNELEAARETVTTLGQTLQGRVRLSVPSGYGQLAMAGWLTDFMRSYPGIALEVIFDNTIEDLMDGRVDCAVRVMNDPPEHLVARHLGPVAYVACATPACLAEWGQPQTLQELLHLPLITSALTERTLRMAGLQTLGQGDAALRMRLVSPNFYFLREALLQGLGVGIVPDYMVRESVAQGALQVLPLPAGSLDFLRTHKYLLYMPTRFQTRAIQTLTEFVHQRALAEAV